MRTPLIVLIAGIVCVAPAATTPALAGQEQVQLLADVLSAADANQAKPPQGAGTQKPPAQTTKPKPTPKLPIGFRFFGAAEGMAMAASETFEAQGGSAVVVGYGGGAEVLNIWKKFFLRTSFSTGSVEGTRGFVIDGDFVSNGVPLKLGVQNAEFSVGWRSYMKNQWIAWYIAGGLNVGTNSQESPDPESGDNDSKSGNGFVGTLGLEFALQKKAKNPWSWASRPRIAPSAACSAKAAGSEGFGESDLGGFSVRGLFGIRFKK